MNAIRNAFRPCKAQLVSSVFTTLACCTSVRSFAYRAPITCDSFAFVIADCTSALCVRRRLKNSSIISGTRLLVTPKSKRNALVRARTRGPNRWALAPRCEFGINGCSPRKVVPHEGQARTSKRYSVMTGLISGRSVTHARTIRVGMVLV